MRKVRLRILCTMLVICGMAACSCSKEVDAEATTTEPVEENIIMINSARKQRINAGKFVGWGTNLAWWANRIGYSDSLTQQAVKLFFDEEAGLGMNIARYNIGGGDEPTHDHITRTDSRMPGFTYYNEETGEYEFDIEADANQRNVLLKIKEALGDKLIAEAYSCSPPYYMTVTGCTSGSDKGITDNLREDCYEAFADYLAEVVRIYKDEYGFTFGSILPATSPESPGYVAYRTQYEGCFFEKESQRRLLIELSESLDEAGLSEVIIAAGEGDEFSNGLGGYRLPKTEVIKYASKVSQDTGTRLFKPTSDTTSILVNSGKDLWATEGDVYEMSKNGSSVVKGEISAALMFAKKIICDVNCFMPSAWVMDQAIRYHICEEGYEGNEDTGMPDTTKGYWGLAVADHDNDTILLTKKYYAYGQFSRYIRPGYTFIDTDLQTVLAAYSEEEHKLVIVAVNNHYEDEEIKFLLENFNYEGGMAKVIRTSGDLESGENWAELPDVTVGNDIFETNLKGYSITTFIIEGISCS